MSTPSASRDQLPTTADSPARDLAPLRDTVTARAFVIGLILSAGLAALNCWIETVANVHFVGGVQMPFGAIFSLFFLVLAVNGPLRLLRRGVPWLSPFSPIELVTMYVMMLFGALVSTPGTDSLFLTIGPALFYFGTRENRWAEIFYEHIPSHFAPGWNGENYQKEVIDPLYLGGVGIAQIPWHAWTVMLTAWTVLLLLVYSMLFWTSLMLRRQWIESEALAFPLVQLPLQMVDATPGNAPPAREFWGNRSMWFAFALAAVLHLLRGLNNFFPDWPAITSFQGNFFSLYLTERPWNALGSLPIELYLGAVGLAYLLTRELVLSFWLFFLITRFELVIADRLGFPSGALPMGAYVPFGGRPLPTFIAFQTMGGWAMMAVLLLWTARGHLADFLQAALKPRSPLSVSYAREPFSPRVVLVGFVVSLGGLVLWCWFSGINIGLALVFLGIYLLTSLVLARLVVEGGFLFPQATYMPMEWMTSALVGTSAMGLGNLTKLSFLQATMMTDMRTNTLPAFLHALKMAHERGLRGTGLRRLVLAVAAAVVVSLAVTLFTTIATLYGNSALSSYSFSSTLGPQRVFTGAATVWQKQVPFESQNLGWMALGAAVVWGLTAARGHWLWFPLHPLGYIAAPSYGTYKLWFSFFVGWLMKTLFLHYGGPDLHARARPFMIGLILGNAAAMVFWMIAGFFLGGQIPYWPA